MKATALMLGALLITASLVSGCSSGGRATGGPASGTPAPSRAAAAAKYGPLGQLGRGTLCAPDQPGHWLTLGLYPLENRGRSPIIIRSVRLPANANIRMTKAWLVPIYNNPKNGVHNQVGVGIPYPPTGWPTWDMRQPAVGGVIRTGETIDLTFGVTRMSATAAGQSGGPVIAYTAGGRTYTVPEYPSIYLPSVCGNGPYP